MNLDRFALALWLTLSLSSAVAQHQFKRGVVWEDNRYNALPARYGSLSTLPPSKSLKAFYPKVIIQPKTDNTGAAWATVWNARTAAEAIACNQTDPQKVLQLAFSPAYNYALIRKGQDCQEAVSLIDLLESLVKNGSPYFSEYREFCPADIPSADLFSLARNKKLSGYVKLYNTSDPMNVKVQSVKNAIASNNAVLAGIVCPPSFQLAQDFWQPRESQADPLYGGHAICVVGYDDTKFGGSFEVLNTWGRDWGMTGYSWIRYKDFATFAPYGFGLFQVGSAACDVPFEGTVSFKELNGQEMKVNPVSDGEFRFVKTYPSGSTFMISLSSNLPAYVYSFGVDPANDSFPLFPRNATTVPITFTALKAPDDMAAITLTDPPGKNLIYLIFSAAPIDLATALTKLKGQRDVSAAKVQSILSNNGPLPAVMWNQKGLNFTGALTGPVVMRVILDQTKK